MSRARRLGPALAFVLVSAGSGASAQSLLSHDWLVLQPEVGVSYANVVAVSNAGLFPSASSTSGFGPRYGLLAGMRFGIAGKGGIRPSQVVQIHRTVATPSQRHPKSPDRVIDDHGHERAQEFAAQNQAPKAARRRVIAKRMVVSP